MRLRMLLLTSTVALAACAEGSTPVDLQSDEPVWDIEPQAAQGTKLVTDDAVGVSLRIPEQWENTHDEVLFDHTYGIFISGEDLDPLEDGPHDREPIARIALVYDATPDQIGQLVQAQIDANASIEGLPLSRSEVSVGGGLRGTALTGLPGTQPYSVVYVASGEQVYEIGLWTHSLELDARAHAILESLHFTPPTRSVHSLGLQSEHASLYWEPTGEMALESQRALAERVAQAEEDLAAGVSTDEPGDAPDDIDDTLEVPGGLNPMTALGCGVMAPSRANLEWQTQWDGTAHAYGTNGITYMSGNGGSWWGQGFHVSCSDKYYHNQFYANDWPLQFGANVYSHFSGTVKYAGWAQGGHYTLGRIVIVRKNGYSSLSAHLQGIPNGISPGKSVNAYSTIIGFAGNSDGGAGYNWAPHLHSRVTYNETYNAKNMPIGGHTVKPRAIRCYKCTNFDDKTADGRRWYTKFFKGRKMRN